MIEVTESTERERTMHISRCHSDVVMKVPVPEQFTPEGFKPSYECKLIRNISVSNLVDLEEAKELNNYLIVRFKSENSVVYYKIDKYDFNSFETNLKGYDPTYVWTEQITQTKIIICHYKRSASNPFAIFSLDGESLTKLAEPNVDQYRSMSSLTFKAGALIKTEDESNQKLFLYLAMQTALPTTMLSYLKYEVDHQEKSTKLVGSSHNFFKGLDLSDSHACFLNNSLFLLMQKTPNPPEKPSIEAYLVDLDNPNLNYSFPLAEFNISLMSEVKVLCKPDHNLIVLRGWVNETDNNKATRKNIYLNGLFDNANYRVLLITEELGSVECDISFTHNYIIERHEDKKDSSSNKNNIRFIRLKHPIIYIAAGEAGKTTEHKINMIVGEKSHDLTIRVKSEKNPIESTPPSVTSPQFNQSVYQLLHKEETNLSFPVFNDAAQNQKHVLNYSGHVLNARVIVPPNSSLARNTSISVIQRIEVLKRYNKSHDISNWDKDQYGGFEKMVLHGDYLGVVSIITKYQTLMSWFILYEFNRTTANLKLIHNFPITSVCSNFDFVTVSENSQKLEIILAIECKQDISKHSLKFYTFNPGEQINENFKPDTELDVVDIALVKTFQVIHLGQEQYNSQLLSDP